MLKSVRVDRKAFSNLVLQDLVEKIVEHTNQAGWCTGQSVTGIPLLFRSLSTPFTWDSLQSSIW
jgi:hypothetical protein